jgi:arylsulfatase A-like enzyme
LYEGALRQAAIARWPGHIPPGRVSNGPWAFWDFLPTALDLAGVAWPTGLKSDGVSLAGFLSGGEAPAREGFYWELHEGKPQQAARMGEWKAVRVSPVEPIQLYNLASDPSESHDLAEMHPEKVMAMAEFMKRSRTEHPDWPLTLPVKKPKS